MAILQFDPSFQFGCATAAFQIEGATAADGRTDSIWDTYCRVSGAIHDGDTAEVACDHYNRLAEDVELMKALGMHTYRFSISWPRVKPGDGPVNEKGLAFYDRLTDALLTAGIRPWVTLYHWDLPQPIQDLGGWANRESAYRFTAYAEAAYERLGDRIETWTTLNEPWCSSLLSYAAGEHAPGHTSPQEAIEAAHHLLLAHGLAAKRLRQVSSELGRKLTLGITLNLTQVYPNDPKSEVDQDAARRLDGLQNRLFLDPIFKGEYPADVLADLHAAGYWVPMQEYDLATISEPIDVLGVNYYYTQAVSGAKQAAADPADQTGLVTHTDSGRMRRSPHVGSERVEIVSRGHPVTEMGWEVHPDGLRELLMRLAREYTRQITMVITENGAAAADVADADDFVDDSTNRLSYIRAHLAAVHEAIEAGAPVSGYLVWSLLDNFEWSFGYSKRFGIVRVNYDTQTRTPKASGLWYRDVARSHQFEMPDEPVAPWQ